MRSLFALFLVACGSSGAAAATAPSAKDPTSAATTPSVAMTPTAFTRDELRAAIHVGRRFDWNVEVPGHAREVHVLQFLAVDEAGAEAESSTLDETGHLVGEAKRARSTWEELRDHAAFPAASTEIADESVHVAAGTYDCRRYTVRDGTRVSRFWFAKKMPGPPVKIVITDGDKTVETRELFRGIE